MTKLHKIITYFILIFPLFGHAAEEKLLFLDTVQVCKYTLAYQDKGSGGDKDVTIYTPLVPAGYFMIGGYAQGNYNKPKKCVPAVKPSSSNADQITPLLVEPATWQLVWKDTGSGANMDGSIWQPVPPHQDYICVGSVGQNGYNRPSISNYRCLHKCLLQNVNTPDFFWSDIGTHADKPISLYKLVNSNSFHARPDHNKPTLLFDLAPVPACNANLETVIDELRSQPPAPRKSEEWINPDEVPDAPSPRKKNEWVNPDEQ